MDPNTDTTEDGSIDAVAASLLEGGQEDVAPTVEDDEDDEQPVEAQDAEDDAEDEDEDVAEDDGDEDDTDDDTDADEDDGEERIPVKVDGKTQLWTLEELKRAASGQGYIQQRMKEVADLRKEAETVYQYLATERQQLAQMYQQLQSGDAQVKPPTPPSRELLEKDPIAYLEAQAEFEEKKQQWAATQAQYQQLSEQQQQLNQQAHHALLQEQMSLLQQAIPEFADKKTAASTRDAVLKNAIDTYGFDPRELAEVADHRQVRVLYDAMRYRQMMAGRKEVEGKTQKARPVVKPGAKVSEAQRGRKQRDKVAARMKQTGSVDDVAKFLLS